MNRIIFMLCLLFPLSAFSQKQLDSLKQLLMKEDLADTTVLVIRNEIAKQHGALNFPDSALQLSEMNLAFIEQKKIYHLRPRVYRVMAYTHWAALGHLQEGINLYKMTLSEAIKYSDNYSKYIATKGLGFIYVSLGHQDSAIYYLNQCLEYKPKDKLETIRLTLKLSHAYEAIGNYLLSLQYRLKALKESEEVQDLELLSHSLLAMGVIHSDLKNFEKSLWYNFKALKIIEGKRDYALILMNISDAYSNVNKGDSAIYYANQSIDILRKLKNKNYLAHSLHYLAKAYKTKREYSNALLAEEEAFSLSNESADKNGIAESANSLSELHFTANQYQKAITYAALVLKLTSEIKSPVNRKNALRVLAITSAKIGKHGVASKYWQSYDSLNTLIYDKEKLQQFANMEALYENNKKTQEIVELNQKASLQELEIRHQRLITNFTLGGIGVSIGLLSIIFYQLKLKRNHLFILSLQKNELEERNKSLQTLTGKLEMAVTDKDLLLKETHHRIKNNLQIISSLLNLQKESNTPDTTKAIQGRILSMSLIHQRLYKQDNLVGVEFLSYAEELMESLEKMYTLPNRKISCNIEGEEFILNADSAIPLGLILFELITNSFKHAFNQSQSGEIRLRITKKESTFLTIDYRDSGPGLPIGFDISKIESLGMKLIFNLTTQLGGKVTFYCEDGHNGKFVFNNI